ncbi:putative Ig domain-containing protein [Cellulomonas sp. C5510]|uniref:putative Ig domain-containing protein n=1 Tax=Cellulomonas sp. C5510 TaxID=2871170 RepID=UPI001C95B1D9|nr:putative Ig domain-containing protein [Cellulomonas sp. C5510]QZN85386.1 putative Ig domain-containing protein [Cellulomonas sp. C5510]
MIVPRADGGLVVGGVFSMFQGSPRPGLFAVAPASVALDPVPALESTVGVPVPPVRLAAVVAPASAGPAVFAATGLPAGLALDSTTGVITGTPTTAGTAQVVLTATAAGISDTTTTTWTTTVPAPRLAVDHGQRSAGQQQGVTGEGFVPGEVVTVTSGYAPAGTPAAGDPVVADGTGRVRTSFTVPLDAPPGRHTVTASSASGTATTQFDVVAGDPGASPDPAPGPGGGAEPGPGGGAEPGGAGDGAGPLDPDAAGGGADAPLAAPGEGTSPGALARTGIELAGLGLAAAACLGLGVLLVHRRRSRSRVQPVP